MKTWTEFCLDPHLTSIAIFLTYAQAKTIWYDMIALYKIPVSIHTHL